MLKDFYKKRKKVINKEKSSITSKTNYGDTYSLIGAKYVRNTEYVATNSKKDMWILIKCQNIC